MHALQDLKHSTKRVCCVLFSTHTVYVENFAQKCVKRLLSHIPPKAVIIMQYAHRGNCWCRLLVQSMYPQHTVRRSNPGLCTVFEVCKSDYGGLILGNVTSSLIKKPKRTTQYPLAALPRPRVHPMWPQHENTPAAARSTNKVDLCMSDKK